MSIETEEDFPSGDASTSEDVTAAERAEAATGSTEPDSMEAFGILRMVAAVAVLVAGLCVAVFQLVNLETQAVESRLAEEADRPILRQTNLEAKEKLTQYAVVDADSGVYRIPIDRALELMAAEARAAGRDVSTERPAR